MQQIRLSLKKKWDHPENQNNRQTFASTLLEFCNFTNIFEKFPELDFSKLTQIYIPLNIDTFLKESLSNNFELQMQETEKALQITTAVEVVLEVIKVKTFC